MWVGFHAYLFFLALEDGVLELGAEVVLREQEARDQHQHRAAPKDGTLRHTEQM